MLSFKHPRQGGYTHKCSYLEEDPARFGALVSEIPQCGEREFERDVDLHVLHPLLDHLEKLLHVLGLRAELGGLFRRDFRGCKPIAKVTN